MRANAVDYARVADICRDAPSGDASKRVADLMGCSLVAARYRIVHARDHGYFIARSKFDPYVRHNPARRRRLPAPAPVVLPPAPPPMVLPPAPPPMVLVCKCGWSTPVEHSARLAAHTLAVHQRPPLKSERMEVMQ